MIRLLQTNDSLGQQIRTARSAAGLTQAALAQRAGIQQSHLSALEHGRHRVTIEILCRLADALGADWGYDGRQVWFGRQS